MPEPSDKSVTEQEIDYHEIWKRGGREHGDEDFALFRCPRCNHIYLVDYETDTLFLNPNDLHERIQINYGFRCLECGQELPSGPWWGPEAMEITKVPWELLESSQWRWVARRANNQ